MTETRDRQHPAARLPRPRREVKQLRDRQTPTRQKAEK